MDRTLWRELLSDDHRRELCFMGRNERSKHRRDREYASSKCHGKQKTSSLFRFATVYGLAS